jgi:hypothetical protein
MIQDTSPTIKLSTIAGESAGRTIFGKKEHIIRKQYKVCMRFKQKRVSTSKSQRETHGKEICR